MSPGQLRHFPLDCPFCGERVWVDTFGGRSVMVHPIHRSKCILAGWKSKSRATRAAVVKWWNKRAKVV